MPTNETTKERVQIALSRLQVLKNDIFQLRSQCQELKRLCSKEGNQGLMCGLCGSAITPNQEVTFDNHIHQEKSHYHRECFKSLLADG